MDWEGLGVGIAFYLMIEGAMPFLSPNLWKKTLLEALHLPEGNLRVFGAISITLGIALLYAIK